MALSERKMEIVRTLVAGAPDHIVDGLQRALSDVVGDSPLVVVRRLVQAEIHDRQLRNLILQPVVPMCRGDGRDPHGLVFPAFVLPLMWKGLKALAPRAVQDASAVFVDFRPGESSPAPLDALLKLAASAVRAREPKEFLLIAELCEGVRPGGATALAACLDIAPVIRRASLKLAHWVSQGGEDTTAGARLAYRDACAISDDAGPLFFEMLAAQLAHPWMVLRIVSAVMDKPSERYLAESELGAVPERVMADIDEALLAVSKLDIERGAEAAAAAAAKVELITHMVAELEACISLSRESGWGRRLLRQKNALASVVEGRIREAEKNVVLSLPTQPPKLRRMRKSIPRLSASPDPKFVTRATTLLRFVHDVRGSANYGGFASARARMLSKVGDHLDHYLEEVLDLIRTGEAESEAVAREFLALVAEYNRLIRDDKAADLVRRRAAAANFPATPIAKVG